MYTCGAYTCQVAAAGVKGRYDICDRHLDREHEHGSADDFFQRQQGFCGELSLSPKLFARRILTKCYNSIKSQFEYLFCRS